ncbi:MAG: TIGR01777 family oxidoreductase [Verrucomicrobiota bacterium]
MKILITGASGLVGSALTRHFETSGHQILRAVRHEPRHDCEIEWHPNKGALNPASLESLDTVIHLAGENIAAHRWSARQKQKIRESRVKGTHLLAETLARLSHPPATLLCASAIGYYGDRGEERLTEQSQSGTGFLAEVCRQWENATQAARQKGVRVVQMRFAMILSRRGGALPKMLTPFRFGFGGPAGNGRQFWSWIAIDDLVGAIEHLLAHPELSGPFNFSSPEPVRSREFARTLGKALHRPAWFPAPAFVLRLVLGEMADGLLLSSARVHPERLIESGYQFKYSKVDQALCAAVAGHMTFL